MKIQKQETLTVSKTTTIMDVEALEKTSMETAVIGLKST